MNIKQTVKNHKKHIFLACVLGVFLTILVYNCLTPYLSDDIVYKSNVRQAQGLFDLVKQQYQEYLSNSGRVVGQFNIRLSLVGSKMIFNVVNSIMFVLLSLLIYWNIEERGKYNIGLYLLTVLAIWRYSVNFGETMLWLCGACNYLWGSVFILGFVTLYRQLLKKKEIKHQALTACGMFLYGVIAGWCNENTSGGGLLLIMIFTLTAYLNGRRKPGAGKFLRPYMAASCLGMGCGLLGIVLSPGVSNRAKEMATDENYEGFLGGLSRFYKCLMEIDHLFFELLIILGIVIIICVMCRKRGRDILENGIPFAFAAAATALVLVLAPTPMNRAYFGAGVFLLIACEQGFFYAFGAEGAKREYKSLYYCAVWILAVGFFFVYVENLVNLARIYREDGERNRLIEEAVEAGQDSVVVPQYREAFRNRFSVAHDCDMTEDPAYWINQFYEGHYGIESISAVPRDEWEAP